MALTIGSEAPDFKAETTEGPIQFHDWMDGKWTNGRGAGVQVWQSVFERYAPQALARLEVLPHIETGDDVAGRFA